MRESFFSFPFRSVIWLLPAALALHELEEWDIAAWEHAQFLNPSDASSTAVRLTLMLVVAAGVAGTAVWWRFATDRVAAIALLLLFGFAMGGNAIMHVYWQLAWEGYAPGSVTSAFVVLPIIVLVMVHALHHRLVSWHLPVGLALLWAAMLGGVVSMGRTMPAAIHFLQGIGSSIEQFLL